MLLIALSAFLSSCGDDYQGDIDKLNGQYTSIDKRVSTLETQVGSMNTQLTQLSVLATAVEQGFYITQVKNISASSSCRKDPTTGLHRCLPSA